MARIRGGRICVRGRPRVKLRGRGRGRGFLAGRMSLVEQSEGISRNQHSPQKLSPSVASVGNKEHDM